MAETPFSKSSGVVGALCVPGDSATVVVHLPAPVEARGARMSFQMGCPKCGGVDFTIHMDRRCAASADKDFALVFSCRCGKQMFGTSVRDEYDRQKRQYEADEGARLEQERAREEQARREVDEAEVTPAPAPQVDVGSSEPIEVDEAPVVTESEVASQVDDDEDSERCAWHQCHNVRRANSKYCSRSCSNKNARARHKKRKRTGDDDDETAAA